MPHKHDPDDFDPMARFYDWVPVPTHARRLRRIVGDAHGLVVDVGGGTGKYTARIFDRKRATILVVDVARRMLERVRTKRRGHPVRANAAHLPVPDRSASVVLCTEAFHHFGHEQDGMLRESARILSDDGILLIEEPHPKRFMGRIMAHGERHGGMHSAFQTPAELSARVAAHFHDVRDRKSGLFTYVVEGRRPRRA